MRSAGIDIASTGYSAYAVAIDGIPYKSWVFKPSNIKDTAAMHLEENYDWLIRLMWSTKPDIISVEELAVFMSKTVIRSLSRHEGIALLAAKKSGAMVVNPGVGQSRSIVFEGQRPKGKAGSLSKDDAWILFKKNYPEVELLAKTSGGLDQMDAYTHALAAPVVLERR